METLAIGELKARFSEVLEKVRNGEEIVISYGKRREKVAVMVPYSAYGFRGKRGLGLLKGRGRCVIHDDFELSDKDVLSS
jgi:prevent-host-death family protein